MKLKIMTTDAIAYVKNNIAELLDYYNSGALPETWLKEKLGKAAFIEINELDFEEFELICKEDKPAATDIYNTKVLYSKMRNINDSFAADERLWAGLAHTLFYDYLMKRWPKKKNVENIINHFFFPVSNSRSYMVNTLARFWWIGRKLYIAEAEDPFYILDYIAHDINGYLFTLFGSNWSNSERSLKLFFDALFRYEKDTGIKIKRGLFNDAMKYANCLGGLYMVDACDDSFISDKIYDFVETRQKELELEAKENKLKNIRTVGIEKMDLLIKAINFIGGHGSLSKIYNAYEILSGKPMSEKTRSYIKKGLEEYSPDSPSFKNKPIFYKIYINDSLVWKVSNDYLVVSNRQNRNKFVAEQLNKLDGNEKRIYHIIASISGDKFDVGSILAYESQVIGQWNDISDFKSFVMNGLKALKKKGLIELLDDGTYKKAYKPFVL